MQKLFKRLSRVPTVNEQITILERNGIVFALGQNLQLRGATAAPSGEIVLSFVSIDPKTIFFDESIKKTST